MANHFIREEYSRLLNGDSPIDKFDSYSIIVDTAIKLIYDQSRKKFGSTMDHDGYMLFQMTMIKGLSIKRIAEGVDYKSPLDKKIIMTGFLEPMSIWTITRSQLEAYCNFSNIYVKPKSKPEQDLLYLLWVIAGLKERQRTVENAKLPENIDKAEREAKQIDKLIEEVKDNIFFGQLSAERQQSIIKGIENRKFQWYFEGNKLIYGAWHQLLANAGITEAFNDLYAMMSMRTHPSNVSVFQFRDMYKEDFHVHSTFFALDCAKAIMSFFIRDYCEYHSGLKLVFNGLPEINQLMVNAYNRVFRGPEYAVNEIERFV